MRSTVETFCHASSYSNLGMQPVQTESRLQRLNERMHGIAGPAVRGQLRKYRGRVERGFLLYDEVPADVHAGEKPVTELKQSHRQRTVSIRQSLHGCGIPLVARENDQI